MVSGTVITNVLCSVEAKRLWNAMAKDSHNLLPKVFPERFASATLLQGDGGVGTIKQLNFISDNKNCSFVKKKVDEINEKKMVYKSTTIEGGSLGKKLRAVSFKVKFVPRKEGGCVAKWTCKYKTLHGVQMDERKLVKDIIENSIAISKKIELYLLSHSTLY